MLSSSLSLSHFVTRARARARTHTHTHRLVRDSDAAELLRRDLPRRGRGARYERDVMRHVMRHVMRDAMRDVMRDVIRS